MEKLQKCVNFILTVPVFFATSCNYATFNASTTLLMFLHDIHFFLINKITIKLVISD
jgi:hypothetical protein